LGKGIATEVAQACLQYGFEQLNLKEIYAMADANNEGSNHILRKLGFRQIESFDLEGILHFWYKIEKSEFIAK
jgi:RimJ/RimL family protein N-acetyltransferase